MTRVAILGTGIMGTGMAHSLRRGGFEVVVWNRSPDKAQAVGEGTQIAETPAEAIKDCVAVITMLSDAEVVAEVAQQFLPALGDAIWLQMSTVGVEGTKRLSQLAAKHEATFVECPVSGTKQPAESGQLRIIAAGPTSARSTVQPLFDAMGSQTFWVDEDPVKASVLKLVVNNWVIGLTGLVAETMRFAEASGIDPHLFLDLIKGAPADSPYAQLKGGLMLEGSYDPSFPLGLATKDARLIEYAAKEAGLNMPINKAVLELYGRVLDDRGNEDMSAVYEAFNRQ